MADLWNIGGALLGGLLGGQNSNKTESLSKDPYAPAQPWINSNIGSGQSLQSAYQAQPFSQAQLNAYGNSAALTDNFRNTAGSLVNQMNGAKTFDRSNPTAKPMMYDFSTPASTGVNTGSVSPSMVAQSSGQPTQSGQPAPQYSNPFMASRPSSGPMQAEGGSLDNSWGGMSTGDKAAYYAQNPAMGNFNQTLQNLFGYSSLGALQGYLSPGMLSQTTAMNAGIDPNSGGSMGPLSGNAWEGNGETYASNGPLSGTAWNNTNYGNFGGGGGQA